MATTSGSAAFNLDLTEIVEEAFERVGSEMRTGYDLKTARRSLNLMFADWANRGVNMWTFEQGTIPLIQGLNTYALPNDTVDLLDHVIRTQPNQQSNQADLTITRISVSTYATIPNKLTQARPIQLWVQRLDGQVSPTGYTYQSADTGAQTLTLSSTANLPTLGYLNIGTETIYYGWINNGTQLGGVFRAQNGTTQTTPSVGTAVYINNTPRITVWPTPDQGTVGNPTYQFVYWRMRRVQDAGGGVNVMDVPFRFIPCMTAGLSYYMALKVPGALDRLPILKQQYDEAWDLASQEDHEKAAVRMVPRRQYIAGGFLIMDIVSRRDAQAKGLKKYFTGAPCRRGHVAERYVTGACCACTSERKKELYQQNRVAVLAYMKVQGAVYRAANPDKRAENSKRWKQDNKIRVVELERKRRAANPEQSRARSRAHYYRHRDRELLRQKVWRMANKGIVNAFTAQRKTELLQRTPGWLTPDDLWLIRQAYELAALRTELFGFAWHVDHKLPLRGCKVSGLHVPTNLQVIPGVENLRKGNRVAGSF